MQYLRTMQVLPLCNFVECKKEIEPAEGILLFFVIQRSRIVACTGNSSVGRLFSRLGFIYAER